MTNISVSNPNVNEYFDEAYFERGWERGTAYVNYKESAASSLIFKTVAEALTTVFRPRKALEIGCATGAIVRSMNFFGVSTYGIDVSEWAVRNALHPNVRLASAANLPFPSGDFDLVYSSHALEHLPQDVFVEAFREIDRVCGPNAIQFHMLPIVGTYPYDYDEATAIRNLQADPTHVLLERMDWWLNRWGDLGWDAVPVPLLLSHDTDNVELSSGQFCLARRGSHLHSGLVKSISDWNSKAFRTVSIERNEFRGISREPVCAIAFDPSLLPTALGPKAAQWDDFRRDFATGQNLDKARFHGIVHLLGEQSAPLRLALISGTGSVLEKWLDIPPGYSFISVDISDFRVLSGDGNFADIHSVLFGGAIGDFKVSANFTVHGPNAVLQGLFDAKA